MGKIDRSAGRTVVRHPFKRYLTVVLFFAVFIAGCAHYPINARLEKYDPDYGYRGKNMRDPARSGHLFMSLSFSGGGTRAAAFAYGVLEGLKNTEISLDGKKTRLVDNIDAIAGVSGGSFTAAYYGLFGDRIFEDFQAKFLKKDIQRELGTRVLFNPYNWGRLFSAYYDRSDLLAEFYDEHVFEGATFADMMKRKGTMILINATDMVHGTRVAFTQEAFDTICSDLSTFSVARACAASSAVPVLLSPITVENYAGTCGYKMPLLLEEALEARTLPDRQFDLANNVLPFLDSKRKPYIHLVDGGVADNLGLRVFLEKVTMLGDAWKSLQAAGLSDVHKVLIVLVNAETEIDTAWDRRATIPTLGAMLDSYSSIAISRYNIETVALLKEVMPRWTNEVRRGRCPQGNIDTSKGACGDIEFYVVEIKFDAIRNASERSYFKRLPTSFFLEPQDVDKLRHAGQELLHESKEFQRFLKDVQQ